jgi:hypothetical protein
MPYRRLIDVTVASRSRTYTPLAELWPASGGLAPDFSPDLNSQGKLESILTGDAAAVSISLGLSPSCKGRGRAVMIWFLLGAMYLPGPTVLMVRKFR